MPTTPADRRERYAETLYNTLEHSPFHQPWNTLGPLRRTIWYQRADAAIKLADEEVLAAYDASRTPAAAVLREADWIVEHCPDHGCVEPETDGCHCEIAERLRSMADETPAAEAEPRAVAYRAPGTQKLHCIICARQETGSLPVTDASEQALCDFCGGRVHDVASRTLGAIVARYLPEEPTTGARQDGALADETPTTETPFTPPAHYRRDDGVDCCVHTIPVGPNSCAACRQLADEEPAEAEHQARVAADQARKDADRAAVLREAADALIPHLGTAGEAADGEMHDSTILWAAALLRRMADETPAAEAHPTEHTWAAELYDPDADEWVPGTRYRDRDRAVNALKHGRRVGPTWKDGTPTQRRVVRATTTYTVELEAEPAAEARQDGADE